MSELSELQGRITAALERIGAGVETMVPAEEAGEAATLRAALDDERIVNAQLEERVRAIREKQDRTVEVLAGEVDRLRALLAEQEETAARLAAANDELRTNNAALREAISEGVAEPHLVNKAMMTELEALRAARGADRAELDGILGELTAMMTAARLAEDETDGKEPQDA